MTTAQDGDKVVSLTHRPPLPPGNAPGTHFCLTEKHLKSGSSLTNVQFKDFPGVTKENHQRISQKGRCMGHDLQQEASECKYSRNFFLGGGGGATAPPMGQGLLIHEVSRSHNDASQSVGLLWRRDHLCLTPHNTHNRQTSMLAVGFEPTSPQTSDYKPTP